MITTRALIMTLALASELALAQESPDDPYFYLVGGSYLLDFESANQPGTSPGKTTDESFSEHTVSGRGVVGREIKIKSVTGVLSYNFDIGFRGLDEDFSKSTSRYESPFHPSRSERKHRASLNLNWNRHAVGLGLLGFYEVERIGSDQFPGRGVRRLESMTADERYLMKPEVFADYGATKQFQTRLALVYFKDVSYEARELSLQSYGAGLPSFELEQAWKFPSIFTTFSGRMFRYHNFFNSEERDFTREGIMIKSKAAYERYELFAMFSSFSDRYSKDLLSQGECSYNSEIYLPAEGCKRRDVGLAYQLGATVSFGTNSAFEAYFANQTMRNHDFPIYDTTSNVILFEYTYRQGVSVAKALPSSEDRLGIFGFDSRASTSP